MASNLQKFFKNKSVLITGHTGFKGSWLSQILLLWGANVTGVALRPATTPSLFNLLKIKPHINNYFADINDFKKIESIFQKEKPEVVLHLAAQPIVRLSYDNPLETFQINTMGTANVLEAIRSSGGVRSAVMITTDKVYKNLETKHAYHEEDMLGGHDPYSSSKASAELIIGSYSKSFFNPANYQKLHKTQTAQNTNIGKHQTLIASARAGNVIGGGDWGKDRIMTDVVRAVFETRKSVEIRNPKAIRPWQYVLEPLAGYLTLAKGLYEGRKELSGAWNFGPQDVGHLQVEELLLTTFKYLGAGSHIITPDFSKHEATLLKLDSSKAKKHLGWRSSTHARDALKLTLDWYQNYYSGGNVIDYTSKQIKTFFNKHGRIL